MDSGLRNEAGEGEMEGGGNEKGQESAERISRPEGEKGGSFDDSSKSKKCKDDGKQKENDSKDGGHGGQTRTVPMWKLFSLADNFDYLLMFLGTVGAALNGAALPCIMLLFGDLMDAFGSHAADARRLNHEVNKLTVKFTYIAAGAAVAGFLEMNCWMMTGERQSGRIRERYLKAILRQNVGFFDKETTTGEVIERMWGDTVLIQDAMGEKVGSFLQLITTFIAGFAVAFSRGWLLTLVMLSVVPLLAGSGAVMTTIIRKRASLGQDAYAEAGSLADQIVSSMRTVASFVGEKKAVEAYSMKIQKAYKSGIVQGFTNGCGMGSLMFIMFCSYALCLWSGSRFIAQHKGYTGGGVLTILFSVIVGSISLGQASPNLVAFGSGRAAAYKMFEVMQREPPIDIADMSGKVLPEVRGEIELRDVHFAYPSRPDVNIFNGFSLVMPAGKMAALVGESGSGKSTVVSLIERFYDPLSGTVCVDGVDIRSLQLKWWRQQLGLVSQEPVLFGTSIRENVAYGKEGATFEEIVSACKMANAHRFIMKLPNKYDTNAGDRGTQLSGGQKQRVAIARAILRNPKILLLDEATSALDTQSERIVQQALDSVMANRTTIVVAHRLSTIHNADMIAVVQRGRVIEIGQHQSLVNKPGGAYAALVSLQKCDEDVSEEKVDGCEGEEGIEEANGDGRLQHGMRAGRGLVIEQQVSDVHAYDGSDKMAQASEGAGAKRQGRDSILKDLLMSVIHSFRRRKNSDVEKGSATRGKGAMLRMAKLGLPDLHYGVLGLLGSTGQGLVFPAFSILLSHMLADFYKTDVNKIKSAANFWALLFVGLACWALVCMCVQLTLFTVVGERLVKRVREMTFATVVRQEIAWFDDPDNSAGVVGARLATDAALVKSIVSTQLSTSTQALVTVIAGLTVAFIASWRLSLVILAIVPIIGAAGVFQAQFIQGFSANAKLMYEQASKVANDAVSSIRTVAAFSAEDKVMGLYNERVVEPMRAGKKQAVISGFGMGFAQFALFNSHALSFWYGGKLVQKKLASLQDVFNVFFAIFMSARSVSHAQSAAPDVGKVKAAASSIFQILDRKSKIDPEETTGEIVQGSFRGEVEFEQVHFAYPTRPDIVVLRDFSLKIPPGITLALVGESGSGKSTVVTLIERFYDPDSGRVLVDGRDVRRLQVKWLRSQVGLVSQEPVLFASSIRENILYGRENATEAEVEAAARAANAHSFISHLPEGYNTLVGERGTQLSGGQKQRVAIARAIIKDPRILLLDEATSALDTESERLVQDALDRMMLQRTTIVIAHRLTTIRNADNIVVMNAGQVVEQGQHDELAAKPGGAYATLVSLNKLSVV
ncbi:hypothetical protein CBR_g19330 [Chara braunii]|uniref:Uncharacterized protein n=1 Tax=Chara braunii TaxID=69332 RepID=A0A388KXT1_CHABU|nr:hypothetical protein CBR_g19330 [Chara braunii]|eukprot:GBG74818.1 hypothetical protein CBR_g19330 [Chara braunii]